MKYLYLATSLLAAFTINTAFADEQFDASPSDDTSFSYTDPDAQTVANNEIESTSASGDKQTTIVDENGNLKIVETGNSTNPTPTATQNTPSQSTQGMVAASPTVQAPNAVQPTLMPPPPAAQASQPGMPAQTAPPMPNQPNDIINQANQGMVAPAPQQAGSPVVTSPSTVAPGTANVPSFNPQNPVSQPRPVEAAPTTTPNLPPPTSLNVPPTQMNQNMQVNPSVQQAPTPASGVTITRPPVNN